MDASGRFRRRALPVAALLTALAVTACDDEIPPPFTVEGTGTVEGLLFLDANDDGLFDPSDGDEALNDVNVAAVVRGTSEVLATGTTGPQGRFLIQGLQPGTVDLLVDTASVPEGAVVCQNPVSATVYIDETTFEDIAARSACLITIAEAQETPLDEFVIVRGRVTSFPGQIGFGDLVIQDETGGIWAFASNLVGQGIENGDLIEIGGVVSFFNGHLELEDVELREVVAEDVGVPEPLLTTTAEIAAAFDPRDPLQNLLVTVEGAELTTGFTAGGDRNAIIDDGTGSTELRIESGVVSGTGGEILDELGLQVGTCYDITGVVGAFNGTAQLFPRSEEDFVEVPCGG